MMCVVTHDPSANLIVAQLLHLESQDAEKDIHFYINSPGGVITSGMCIYDTMQFIKPDICTYVMGQARRSFKTMRVISIKAASNE